MTRFEKFIEKGLENGDAVHVDLATLCQILEIEDLSPEDTVEYVKAEMAAQGLRLAVWSGRESTMATMRRVPDISAEKEDAMLAFFGSKSESTSENPFG